MRGNLGWWLTVAMPRLEDEDYNSTLRNSTQQFDNSSRFESSSGDFGVDDKVEALYKGRGNKWYSGKICRVNRDGTYDIRYDDGDNDIGALQTNIRRHPDAPARRHDRGGFRGASDMDRDMRELRFAVLKAVDNGSADAQACFEYFDIDRRGELNEVEFLRGLRRLGFDVSWGEAVWDKFPGRRRDSLAYIDFVCGLRLSDPAKARRSDGRFDDEPRTLRLQEGSKVEARYRGKSRYYPGVIRRVNRDGTFDVDYDDGEKEIDVSETLIRAIDDRRDEDQRGVLASRLGHEAAGVSLIAAKVRDQLWEWARSIGKGTGRTREALRKVFRAIDKGNSGLVTRAEMATLLSKKMKLRLPAADLEVLLDCIDVEGSGRISYEELVDFACNPPEGDEIGVLHERISRDVARSGADLLRGFERYDERRRGVVRGEDLARVLERCGVERLRTSDVDELLKRFALGSKREVDYDLFVLWAESGRDLRRAEQRVRTSLQRLVSMGLDFRRIFELMDKSRTGFLDEHEFRLTMQRLGLMLAESEVRALFHKYNTRGAGLRYGDFLELANESLDDLKAVGLLRPGVVDKLAKWVEDHGAPALRKAFAAGDKGGKGLVAVRHFDKVRPPPPSLYRAAFSNSQQGF